LNLLGHSDRKLPQLLMNLAGMNTTLPVYTKEYVTNLVKSAQTIGRAAEGKQVFEQTGCIACHMPGAPQSKIGPDLSAISRSMPIDIIIGEIIWPALNVKEGYEAATVTMKDGSILAGFKHTETTDTIDIRDPATGAVKSLVRASTAKIQTGGSLMPDGLTATLSEQQLADLIRYVSELGK
jgi:putative heme-binding domain-containing protein